MNGEALAAIRRNDELRAIMNVIALNRPERRADALADFETLLEEREELLNEPDLHATI